GKLSWRPHFRVPGLRLFHLEGFAAAPPDVPAGATAAAAVATTTTAAVATTAAAGKRQKRKVSRKKLAASYPLNPAPAGRTPPCRRAAARRSRPQSPHRCRLVRSCGAGVFRARIRIRSSGLRLAPCSGLRRLAPSTGQLSLLRSNAKTRHRRAGKR